MLSTHGISYFVDGMSPTTVRTDLGVIRDDLHCNAVMLIGTDARALVYAADEALGRGLETWIRPHLDNGRPEEVLSHLGRIAYAAEALHRRHPGRVTLLVGTEFSLTARGIVPGGSTFLRLMVILRAGRLVRGRIRRRLDTYLDRAVATARTHFSGPLSYGAAGWEDVDWSRFDLVGVNLYRYGEDRAEYEQRVRALVEDNDRPVVITEFGCGAFEGAEGRGAGAFMIVNWFSEPPVIRGDHPRDEDTQARYLDELIDVYAAQGVSGCFVFNYATPDFPRHDDPEQDLDRAGFGVVAVPAGDPDARIPKRAFAAVAGRYRDLAAGRRT